MRIIVHRTCAFHAPRLTRSGAIANLRSSGIVRGVIGALLGVLLLCCSPVWALRSAPELRSFRPFAKSLAFLIKNRRGRLVIPNEAYLGVVSHRDVCDVVIYFPSADYL